jgi:hypothetical protein
MTCRSCGATIADGSELCDSCEATLILAKPHHLLGNGQLARTPDVLPATHHRFLYEQVWQTLADYQAKQQDELARLRSELEGKLKTLEAKPKAEEKHSWMLRISDTTIPILVFALAGFIGFIWFIYKLVNFHREIRFDNIAILATTLTVIGSMYLAYDLLGRQHGPLRWVSLFVTSGLVGAITLEPLAVVVATMEDIPGALQVLLIGIVVGSFTGILFAIPEDPRHPRIFSGRASISGGVLGIFFWLALLSVFGTLRTLDSFLLFLLISTLLGVPTGILLGGFHHFFRGNYRPGRPPLFSWQSSLKAFGIILLFWGIIALLTLAGTATEKQLYGETPVVALIALSSAIPAGFAPHVFWWLNHLPERVLGAVGFVLTLIGAMLPVIQPIFNVLTALKR